MEREGLGDWKVADGEAYCWKSIKTINVEIDSGPAIFLHEVAHAIYQEPEGPLHNHYHGGQWAAEYGRLVDAYMEPKDVPPASLRLRMRGPIIHSLRHVWWYARWRLRRLGILPEYNDQGSGDDHQKT